MGCLSHPLQGQRKLGVGFGHGLQRQRPFHRLRGHHRAKEVVRLAVL
jgi:hypothetical protein